MLLLVDRDDDDAMFNASPFIKIIQTILLLNSMDSHKKFETQSMIDLYCLFKEDDNHY